MPYLGQLLTLCAFLSAHAAGPLEPNDGGSKSVSSTEQARFDANSSHAPAANDFTAAELRRYRAQLVGQYRGGYRDVPLDLKAAFFEWQIWKYHQAANHQVYNRVRLPSQIGDSPVRIPGSDTSTWNGALLAALSHKYAVTKDKATLSRIASILEGLHLFLAVTGQNGLLARSIAIDEAQREEGMQPYTTPQGRRIYFRSDAAKGTYNQVVGGYAAMMMFAYDDLSESMQRMARTDLTAMVLHVLNHDYHLTERDGRRTRYGDITPLYGSVSVPFNAQVAYLIVAAARFYPSDDPQAKARIEKEFRRLRYDHHVYYQRPLLHVVQPQRIGASPFLKGMNDRNHVTNAAFAALAMERHVARKAGNAIDPDFFYEMGRTMYWSMRYLESSANSLCNFMWAGILTDPEIAAAIIPSRRDATRAQLDRILTSGVEQLRRFKLDRFSYYGREEVTRQPQWVDLYRPDDYHWKCNPKAVWHVTGPATDEMFCATDYLYAYWLMRYYRLDRHPALAAHRDVLRATPRLAGTTLDEPPGSVSRNQDPSVVPIVK